jgi:hypothetical protein
LTFSQVITALAEINEFQRGEQGLPELKVYFTGGEPCMWRDEGMDLVDILLLVANQYNSKPRFDTNGVLFAQASWCEWFLDKYFQNTRTPLKIIFSCDQFHRGTEKSSPGFRSCDEGVRLPAVDRVIEYGRAKNVTNRLDLEVMWVASTHDKHAFPTGLRQAYPRVEFSVVPLLPAGAGESLAAIAPRLRVHQPDGCPSAEKGSLGSFLPHLLDALARKGKSEAASERTSNENVFETLSVCGDLPNPFFCWGGVYYYCIPRLGEPEFRVAEIGSLLEGVHDFEHAGIAGMRKIGILPFLRGHVNPGRLEECLKQEHFLRYVGCSFCRALIGSRRTMR